MEIYLLFFLLLLVSSFFELLKKKPYFFWGAVICLILFAGLRYKTGYDFDSYSRIYDSVTSLGSIFSKNIPAEPGFLFLNYLFKSLGFDFSTFVLFFSMISMLLLANFTFCFSKFPSFILLYYYSRFFLVRDMGQIRSAFVAIICLYALPYIQKREFFKVCMISIFASLFHVVGIFLIPAYLFSLLIGELNLKKVIATVSLSAIVGIIFFNPQLFLWMIPSRYAGYFAGNYVNGKWIFNPVFVMQLMILVVSVILLQNENEKYKKMMNTILQWYLISTCLLILFGPLATVGGRISTIFATSEILVVPYLFSRLFKHKALSVSLFYLFCFCIFVLIFIISGAYNSYIPYLILF
ncbi:EpsG family protein [Enterococcus ratti]|uniref:EpsG family protein n=1 Tax=Enterococcus ratti TaxID=150033 RepID=UPI00351780EF